MITRKILWQRILALPTVLVLCACAVDSATAEEQGRPDQVPSYYYCQIWIRSPGNATMYVSQIIPTPDPHPSKDAIETIAKAWTGYMFHTYSPEQEKEWLDREMSMDYGDRGGCMNNWPYPTGLASMKETRDHSLKGGAKEVAWDYAKNTYVAPAPAPQPPAASADPCNSWNPHGLTIAPPAGCPGAIKPPTPIPPYTFCTSQSP